jgi:transposase
VAVRQPTMRFVSVKSVDDQAVLSWHRARSGFMEERKSLLNRTPGLAGNTFAPIARPLVVTCKRHDEYHVRLHCVDYGIAKWPARHQLAKFCTLPGTNMRRVQNSANAMPHLVEVARA